MGNGPETRRASPLRAAEHPTAAPHDASSHDAGSRLSGAGPTVAVNTKFHLSPDQLFRLLDQRNPPDLHSIGGLQGLCEGLRTDPSTGLSADETELDDVIAPRRAASVTGDLYDGSVPLPRPSSPAPFPQGPPSAPFSDRRRVFGENRLPEPKTTSFVALMWRSLNNKLMFLLAASAVVSLALGVSQVTVSGGSAVAKVGWMQSATIIGAILATVIATAANDYQKNYKFRKLSQKCQDRQVTAIRSGTCCRVSIFDVVVGDILRVEPGNVLAADGVLVEASRLFCDESHLSGEAELASKVPADEFYGDGSSAFANPFMYSGATVSQGIGTYVVTAVGVNSSSGRTAMSLRNEVETTLLQQKLARLAGSIVVLGSVIGLLYFVSLFTRFLVNISTRSASASPREKGEMFLNVFMLAIAVVVIAVPEGLSLAVAVALASASTRMLKDNILARLLQSCEVMGSATTVCLDKTGTLTRNEMTVASGLIGCEEEFGPEDDRSCASRDTDNTAMSSFGNSQTASRLAGDLASDVKWLLKLSIAANSTAFEQDGTFVGGSTEVALLKFAREHLAMGPLAEERANVQVVDRFPFDADRKYMATIIKHGDKHLMLVKGAAEVVLGDCATTLENTKKNFNPRGELVVADVDESKREMFESTTHSHARNLLRPVAVAYRDLDSWPPIAALGAAEDPTDTAASFDVLSRHQLTFVAMFALHDPLRPEAITSVRQCRRAGISVRLLTGDNLAIAEAIAMKCGIYRAGGIAMDGPTFRRLTPEQANAVLPRLQVLARSNANDKAMLVTALKRLGETVAVAGDGTNDALALKEADIGFSMGSSGTEVAKQASSIVVLDDNFASIVKALAWGRRIIQSVQKYCQFQFTLNLTAAVITIVSTLVSGVNASVFQVVQLLWLNLVMDILTAVSFSMDYPPAYLMRRGPEPRNSPLTSTAMWKMILGQSIYQLAVVFALHYAGSSHFWPDADRAQVQTVVFNAYMFMQVFNQLNCRRVDNGLDVFEGLLEDIWFLGVQALSVFGQILIVFTGGNTFGTVPLTGQQWGWSVMLGILVIPVGVVIRYIPDAWVTSTSRALEPLAWPLLVVFRRSRTKKADTKRQETGDANAAAQGTFADGAQKPRGWLAGVLGRKEQQHSPELALTAVDGAAPTRRPAAAVVETRPGSQEPLDLLAAIEASKHGADGALAGLHVHPDTAKDNPVAATSVPYPRRPPTQM
ncbi:hypothetical protein GGTG_02193 [Gaeumannomyces tritici R3-111a-1]|uniref:Cation-transporting P-type ATPase N-terminal domain-containing protein n=1 Tax=Gaeumannomyces tritici (strain R3-111a-1) TaxID=644352 RepID=J3NLP3_GAET3|nr:hypothetical protein GGTG_02193 [Gaeumannomyces tritici R3-111a-1]EJT82219.1 hypothetical protein GGTG_02193 [Gaeumannomyces tritici R3-111a-1]